MGLSDRSIGSCVVWRRHPTIAFSVIVILGLLIAGETGSATAARSVQAAEVRAAPTRAYASAALGHLLLSAAVFFGSVDVRFLAGWSSAAADCRSTRRVVIDATLAYTPLRSVHGLSRVFSLHRAGGIANCGESGPNFGEYRSASELHLACGDGRWLPGHYSLTATAVVPIDAATPDMTLRAVADLVTGGSPSCR